MKQVFGDDRVAILARKNRSVDERVQQVRSATVEHGDHIINKAKDKERNNTVRLRNIYNHSLKMFEDTKRARREIFAHMSSR